MTLEKVARSAGVDAKTARKALLGNPSVRPHLRKRVLTAARELDYQPNLVARALREKSLQVVPICVQKLDQLYFGRLAGDLSAHLVDAGLEPALCFSPEHLVRMSRSLSTSASVLVAGFDIEVIRILAQRQKVVMVDARLPPMANVGVVEVDFPSVYRHAVAVLLRQGRRRIALCSPYYVEATARGWSEPKFETVLATLREAGLEPVHAVFATADDFGAWLQEHPHAVDAVFCQNDETAARVVGVVARRSMHKPDDLLVIGCDGSLVLSGTWTVRVETSWLAVEAVGLLRRLLDGGTTVEPRRYPPLLVDDHDDPIELTSPGSAQNRARRTQKTTRDHSGSMP